MQALFSEIVELCKDEIFLRKVLKKYHYPEDERELMQDVAARMANGIGSEGCWATVSLDSSQSVAAVGMTLGEGVDSLQEAYTAKQALTEAYMVEVLSSELLLECYRVYERWVRENTPFHVKRLYFLGNGNEDSIWKERLAIEHLPSLLTELSLPIHCNEAYCMLPKKSVVFYADFTKDPAVRCATICTDCGRLDCPNRMEDGSHMSLRFADMTDRPLPYGYMRIFSKKV